MQVPNGTGEQPQINAAVVAVTRELSPDVHHIRFEIADDWSGQTALYFRVVLSDEASKKPKLREIVAKVAWMISERLDLPELGLFPYFDFRSESEQAQLNQTEWAAIN